MGGVGATVGALVGALVGAVVGAAVGAFVVGAAVGAAVGDFVGAVVGAVVGAAVGAFVVGAALGAAVGDFVGATVGAVVGEAVGDFVGAVVGAVVGVAVGDFVGAAVGLSWQLPATHVCPAWQHVGYGAAQFGGATKPEASPQGMQLFPPSPSSIQLAVLGVWQHAFVLLSQGRPKLTQARTTTHSSNRTSHIVVACAGSLSRPTTRRNINFRRGKPYATRVHEYRVY